MTITLSGTRRVFFLMKVRRGQLMQRTARQRKKPILVIIYDEVVLVVFVFVFVIEFVLVSVFVW